MDSEREPSLEMPYGKIAAWGVAASAAVTLAAVVFAPLSPWCAAKQALRGAGLMEDGRAAVAISGDRTRAAAAVARVHKDLGRELAEAVRQEIGPELRRELRIEMRREFRSLVERDLGGELSGSLIRMLGAWHVPVGIDPGYSAPSAPVVVGI